MIYSVFSTQRVQIFTPSTRNSKLETPNPESRIPTSWWVAVAIVLVGVLLPVSSHAQSMTGGWVLQLYGMVQVEPGANVVTLDVKKEHIRFVIHNVRSSDRDFSTGRFYSETTNRVPGLYMKGPDEWLELLLKERPGKRVLKITGVFYSDSRTFIINNLSPYYEERKKEF